MRQRLTTSDKPLVFVSLQKSHSKFLERKEKILLTHKTLSDLKAKKKSTKQIKLASLSSTKKKISNLPLFLTKKEETSPQKKILHKNHIKKRNKEFIASGTIVWPSWLSKKESLISIRREFEGQIYEEVIVSSHYPHYDLKLKSPFGELVVEIFNSKGHILARSRKDLQGTKPLETRVPRGVEGFVDIKDERKIKVSLWPFSEDFISLKRSAPFIFDNLKPGSSYFLSLKGDSQKWNHLSFGRAGEFHYVDMLSSQFVKALLYQILENPKKAEVSVVWGRVIEEGLPQEGVTVEMGGSYEKPIYFTGFAPDFKRNKTSKNGLFVFLTDREGICPVRGVKGDKIYSVKTVFCQKETVSLVELDRRKAIPISVRAYDPFLGDLKQARIDFLGEEIDLVTHKKEDVFVSLPIGSGDRFLTAESLNYETTHMNVQKKSFSVEVPLIKTSWLKRVLKEKNISVGGHEGLVIGFLEKGQNFELFLDGTPYKGEIILFDSQGEIVSKNSSEVKGFLITDLSLGFHNLSLFFDSQDEKESLYNEVLFVEPEGVNVMVYESSSFSSNPSSKSRPHHRKTSYFFWPQIKTFVREKMTC